jgi:hypothetical protein
VEKGCPIIYATSIMFTKNYQSKQSPIMRKLAKSGHPAPATRVATVRLINVESHPFDCFSPKKKKETIFLGEKRKILCHVFPY